MPTRVNSYDLVGKVEDVSAFISMITPTDTPFSSSIKDDSTDQTLYQWQEDALRAVAKNAKVEGFDAQDSDRDQPAMRSNGTQIIEETYKVTGTSDAVKTHGRKKASAYEAMKTGKLLKMDLEHSMVGTGQEYVVGSAGVAPEFAGVQAQIAPEVTTDMAGAALSEAAIIDTHETLYNEGSDATVLMVKPSDTKVISDFAMGSQRTLNVDNGEKKLTRVVNVYESPFGTVRVVKNRRIRPIDSLMYEPKNFKRVVLRNWFRTKLAKTGDNERYMMVGQFGLKHTNQKASALITNLG